MTMVETSSQGIAVEEVDRSENEKKVRAHVRVFGKWCKGCGLCIAFCPRQVFEEDEQHHPVVAHEERCIACQWCVIHCPDFAIIVDTVKDDENEATQ